jgi:hypothetical protein
MSEAQAAIQATLFPDHDLEWQMGADARCALLHVLRLAQPEVAIEIGTRFGGSLVPIARHAKRAFSLDIDPTCAQRLAPRFTNVEFVTGSSHVTLAPLVARLAREQARLGFVLIDGDHTADGVRLDVLTLLDDTPRCPLFVLMHDSFNPDCRRGMREAPWSESRHVRWVSLDFVAGGIEQSSGPAHRQMWGGFALAYLDPEPRRGNVHFVAHQEWRFQLAHRASAHYVSPLRAAVRAVRRALSMR